MTFRTFLLFSIPGLVLGACASVDAPGPGAVVHARLETPSVGTVNADAADDPAIWASPRPVTIAGVNTPGFVAGTDKKAGLYIYGFDGAVLQFLPAGLLNNVDVIDGLSVNGRAQVLLGASDRSPGRMGASLYLFDLAASGPDNAVRPWGLIPSDLGEPYGFCFGRARRPDSCGPDRQGRSGSATGHLRGCGGRPGRARGPTVRGGLHLGGLRRR